MGDKFEFFAARQPEITAGGRELRHELVKIRIFEQIWAQIGLKSVDLNPDIATANSTKKEKLMNSFAGSSRHIDAGALVGRLLLGAIFVWAGYGKALSAAATTAYFEKLVRRLRKQRWER